MIASILLSYRFMNLRLCSVGALLLMETAVWAVPELEIEGLPEGRFRMAWPTADEAYVLEESSTIGTDANWVASVRTPSLDGEQWVMVVSADSQSRFYRLVQVSTALARLIESSPAAGETGVSVNRETVFRFNAPLATDTVLDASKLSASAAGRPLLTRVELATDRLSAALFYLEPLPSGTRVTARLNGFGVLDATGRALDADLDGLPGGVGEVTFTTVNSTAIGNTAVHGRVLASEKNADGTDRPLPGVTVTVDGAEQSLRAVTGADGSFVLAPAPAGRFFVHVDGRTSSQSQWPGGAYYPFVGKAWEAEPGRTNNLANGDGLIYLPRVPGDALRTVSSTETTVVQFAPSLLATNPAMAGVEVRVPANALFGDDGNRGGRVGISPVAPDRLPEPLPPGLSFPLVITIQTDGPSNFDRPVPVRFPNLPDPITGLLLPPGAKTALWSFDHDTGRWEIAGPMTISADGRFADTDPGVGVRQPGWHGAAPGGSGEGPEGDPEEEEEDDCEDGNFNGLCDNKESDPCELLQLKMMFSFTDTVTGLAGLIPDVEGSAANCALAFTTSALQGIRDCGIEPEECFKTDGMSTVSTKLIDFGIGCASSFAGELKPVADAAVALKSILDSGLAYRAFRDCRINNPRSASQQGPGLANVARGNPFLLQYELETRLGALMDLLYGPGWRFIHMKDMPLFGKLLEAIRDTAAANSEGGVSMTPSERNAILSMPRPDGRSIGDVDTLISRFQRILPGGDPTGFDRVGVEAAIASLQEVLEDIVADGWRHTHEGYALGFAIYQQFIASVGQGGIVGIGAATHGPRPAANSPVIPGLPARAHAWWLMDLSTGFVRRGMLNANGKFEGLILAPRTDYLVAYADPLTGRAGVNQFRSGAAGRRTVLPGAVMMAPPGAPDRDADGLSDLAEVVLGTDADEPDTDGDGVFDGAEFHAGGQPLGVEALPFGVIGGADTLGEARDLAIDGNLAVVLDGSAGLALFDLADPRIPLRIIQFPLPRPQAVALAGGLALIGQNDGATLLDLRSPSTPMVIAAFPGASVPAVALASPFGYFGRGRNVQAVDLKTGALLLSTPLPALVDELAVDGDLLHVLTREALHIFRRTGSELTELSRTPVVGPPAPLEVGRKLFAGGGRAYVGHFEGFTILSITNPLAPRVLATQPSTQAAIHDFAENGSGILAAITSFGGQISLAFSLYDVASGNTTTNFLTSLPTPGDPFAVVLHRGLAYVASDGAGLQVINYLNPDALRQRPNIAFGPPLSTAPTLEAGTNPLLTFITGDDVAVREVELFANGARIGSAGSFPFQIPMAVAPPSPGQTSVVLRARATDTGGNERWTDELRVALTPDQTPPLARLLNPADGAELPPGGLASIVIGFNEPMKPDSFPTGLTLHQAGPDGGLGTADDTLVKVEYDYDSRTRTLALRLDRPFVSERYRLTATARLTDASGVALASPRSWDFRVLPPVLLGTTPNNNSNHRPGNPTLITARLSTVFDVASLRAGGFLLDHAGPDNLVGTADDVPIDVSALMVSSESNRMSFAPSPALRTGRYRARLTTNAMDVLGNRLLSTATWNFTVLAPNVASMEPANGHARPFGEFKEVHVGFTDLMDPLTLATGIHLALTNGTPVSGGIVHFDNATLTATLSFPAPLPIGEYRLRVTTQATDVFGNPIAAEASSIFGIHGPVAWAVDADGRWDVASNWSPARPVAGDDVRMDRPSADIVINHTTGNSLVSGLVSTEAFRLTGGSLALHSNSLMSGPLLVQGATLSNRAELRLTGATTFGPGANIRGGGTIVFAGTASIAGGSLVNSVDIGVQTFRVESGPLTWTSGDIGNDGQSTNAQWIIGTNGTLEAVVGSARRDWQGNRASLWNRGTFRQTGSTNLLRWTSLNVTNDGVWDIVAGHAELEGGLQLSGRLALAEGTSLKIRGDSAGRAVTVLPGGRMEGAGNLSFEQVTATFGGQYAVTGASVFTSLDASFTGEFAPGAGALSFVNTDAIFDVGPLTLNNAVTLREGTLDFRHPTTLSDFRWQFGRVRTTGDLTIHGLLTIGLTDIGNSAQFAGPGRLRVNDGLVVRRLFTVEANALIEHSGTCIWQPMTSSQSTALDLDSGATFRNLADGRFVIATNRTIGGAGTFENLGVLVKASGMVTNDFHAILENHGKLEVAEGHLRLSGGGTLGGTVALAEGTVLEIIGASQRPGWFLSGAFSGGGILQLRGGSNTLTGVLAGPKLLMNGGALRLPPDSSLANAEIRGGAVFTDGLLRLTGTNSIVTGNNTRLHGPGVLRNEGRVTEATAWFDGDIENAGDWIYSSSTRPRYGGVFRNLPGATYTVTNSTSSLSQGPNPGTFDNAGLFRQLGQGNARLPFAVTNRGIIEITDTLTADGDFTQPVEGLIRLQGGTLVLGVGTLSLSGEIQGPGIVERGGSVGEFISNCQLSPGTAVSYGVLSFNMSRAQLGPDGGLVVRIGGVEAATQHDQLRATGSLRLGGKLRLEFVSGFAPELGQKFLIVTANPRLLTFRNDFEVVGLPAGLKIRLNHLTSGVEAEVIPAP